MPDAGSGHAGNLPSMSAIAVQAAPRVAPAEPDKGSRHEAESLGGRNALDPLSQLLRA